MYQAIPYGASRAWPPRPQPAPPMEAAVVDAVATASEERQFLPVSDERRRQGAEEEEEVRRAVAECPVLVVGRRGCCLSHVVERLLQGLGVNPAVHEVAADADLAAGLAGGDGAALPAVFVGGRLLGGLDRLMAVHISGDLVPILKDAGALWL